MKILFAVALLLLPVSAWAQAQPKTIEDCESIKEPLAYNACLAAFGPTRHGDGPVVSEEPPPEKQSVGGSGGRGKFTRSRGRSHAEFDLGKSKGKAVAKAPRKKSTFRRHSRRKRAKA